MTEILSNDDADLLKSYLKVKHKILGRSLHNLIEEHKKTPCSVLEILIKTPQKQIDFLKTSLITVLAFAFGYSANYKSPQIEPILDFLLSISVIIMLITAAISLFFTMYLIGIVDEKWTLLKFIIVLKSTNENEKADLRSYLKEQTK